MALDHDDASDAGIAAEVESADVVYLTGGNPAHLLETLRDSLLLDSIQTMLERGGTLAGSSAGAMVMGSWDEVQRVAAHTRNRGGHSHAAAPRTSRPGYGSRRAACGAR